MKVSVGAVRIALIRQVRILRKEFKILSQELIYYNIWVLTFI